jgi:hypothetical protein
MADAIITAAASRVVFIHPGSGFFASDSSCFESESE